MNRRFAVPIVAAALTAAALTVATAGAQAEDEPDWGSNLVTNGDFETDPEVGAPPPDWTMTGSQTTNPSSVVEVGDGEHALRIGARDSSGTDVRGLSWQLPESADRLKAEFSFAVPDLGAPRSLEFWTRGEGQTNAVSQVTLAYQNGKLEQAGPVGTSQRHLIGEGLTTSDETTDDYTWYRLRSVVDADSNEVRFWLSGPDQPLPAESEPPTATTPVWNAQLPVKSINFGFSRVYDDAYYLVDDVDVRAYSDPVSEPDPSPLDPIEGGDELLLNTDFAYDGIGSTPVGWAEWPGHRASSDLGVSATGVGDADRSLRVRGAEASGSVAGLAQQFEPQRKAQIEFSFAFTEATRNLDIWTLGPVDRETYVSQANLRIKGTTLQQYDGTSWRNLVSLAPSIDVDQDGELVDGTDEITWHRMRVVVGKDHEQLAIWLAEDGEEFAEAPDFEPTAYETHTSITGLAFGYTKAAVDAVYHVGDISVTGLPDPDPTETDEIDRFQLWDGFAGTTAVAGAPEPEDMERSLIHVPEPEDQWPPEEEDLSTEDCSFLHGVAIHEHEGTLYASWENGPKDENSSAAMMRGARSTDWGETWSEAEVVAPNPDFEDTDPAEVDPCSATPPEKTGKGRSHGAYVSWGGDVYAYVAAYDFNGQQGRFRKDLHAELWKLDAESDEWVLEKANVIDNLWPIEPPRQMDNGKWIMASIDRDYKAVYAISDTNDPTGPWTTTTLPNVEIPSGTSTRARYTEATTWVDGPEITLVIRTQAARHGYRAAGVARSHDYGQTWENLATLPHYLPGDEAGEPSETRTIPMTDSNVLMTAANPFVGTLSTGQRYLISNIRNRHALTILVSRVGEDKLSQTYLINNNPPEHFYPGAAKGRQYNQPYAIEVDRDGEKYLYVVYSVNKEAAELAVIPVSSLAGEPAALASVELADNLAVSPGGSVDLAPVASRVDGTVLDWRLAEAKTFHTDRPDVVSFGPEGTMTLSESATDVDQVQVWAEFDYGLGPVSSDPVAVTVRAP